MLEGVPGRNPRIELLVRRYAMKRWSRVVLGVALGCGLWLGARVKGWAQFGGQAGVGGQPTVPGPASAANPGLPNVRTREGLDPDKTDNPLLAAQQRSRNTERQRRIEADTARLLELATELKEQLAKGDPTVTAAERAKELDEIARLAKSVRERMRG